ncbi:putative siderophore-degrading esterase [Eremomyces bilateralis CBS 781.70]|uniref:Siderophore-degrading esterase n=1 Tax=Eremomyces bilateralis CBS 781.70 TaxID=1392243 RepID=A0A6G1GBJ1_9PEZI|nr:putative siderophore-degrading esterase [Eremomyces bilateralis CBS 781.70]KAF1815342.1 putative siderophore-degrading esterase [Eremomyces bilateralis CBS 781.70]
MTKWTFSPSQPGTTRNMASWQISRQNHEPYQIDVSWPLAWSAQENSVANAIYLVDGNALFLSATETLRRRQSHRPQETGTVVVAVGYPLTDSVFSPRRSVDLTPPCGHYTPPDGPDGKPKPNAYGGADKFLTFITEVVQPFITLKVFPQVSFDRTAIFGHSYGGLFVLHTLFTRPSSFDVYLAASPSIWWNDRFILSEAARFRGSPAISSRPVLRLSYGSREQAPVREPGEPWERFQWRKSVAERRRMADNCNELYSELLSNERFRIIQKREYLDEDHGSVIAAALSGGLVYFLDQSGEYRF